MRWKIIVVNGGIVLLVGVLVFAVLLTTLGKRLSDPAARKLDVDRAIKSANAQLALDGMLVERWLTKQAAADATRSVFLIGNPKARGDAATTQANRIAEEATSAEDFRGMQPTLVLFVDKSGLALGRNDAALMRGDNMGSAYPGLHEAVKSGQPSSAVWLNPERQEQLFASYVPVPGENGEILGLLVLGTPANDDRLDRTSNLTSGEPLGLAVMQDGNANVIAKTHGFPAGVLHGDALEGRFVTGEASVDAIDGYALSAAPLAGYVEADSVLVAVVPSSLVEHLPALLWPVWGITALGLAMVVVAGFMIGSYLSRPISQLEEGLLMIINGKTDMRFELQHAELGGLVSRINSLLNALTGVSESDDDSGT